ncbi:MAG: sigma-54-dependent Fis family transcriptional regulator [Alphaproteobacteria bacterium]|nr:sigma-54-dependent Fis family transcriptional regulator [Alphaproteobacteria bacterium]
MAADILIVDDEPDIRSLIADILSDEGYAARVAGDSSSALALIDSMPPPALAILDIWLEGSQMDGMELLEQVRLKHPDLPVLMISGHGNIETAVAAIKRGAYDFIEKPFKTDRLLVMVSRALEAARLRRENAELRLRLGPEAALVGRSSAIATLRAAGEKVAPTGSRVFISGPAGSGKETLARYIHDHSRRGEGPLVVVNAALMGPEGLEIQLFGTEGGYPDSNSPRRVGMFERAHGGTLYFDEIADMPLETQAKIVRVLQEQTFERVGGGHRVHVDVRVMAATNHDIKAEIEAGQFREDLFYRLNVVPMRMPALAERREDIPELVTYFFARAAESSGLPRRTIGPDALAVLQSYDWPGNVRQLRNVVEWVMIMSVGDTIRADMLPPELTASAVPMARADGSSEIMGLSLREAREVFERNYLTAQIGRFGGNISRTAQFVGMERSALHRKLKSLGIGDDERTRDRAS